MEWALGGKAKFITRLETFETLVNRLHSLVPPAGMRLGTALGASAGSKSHTTQTEGEEFLLAQPS
jgi:hypothetical protein